MNRWPALLLMALFSGCTNYGQLTYVTQLPKKLRENSGIVFLKDSTIWVIEDGENPDEIYQVDFKGRILRELEVKNAKNKDWEDLAKDEAGNLYISDTGNNKRERKELTIYKIPNPDLEPGSKIDAQKIVFRYPNKERHDAEALFYREDFLYLITKDRSRPFTGEAHIFKVPAKIGEHTAIRVGRFTTCAERHSCEVTAADISPNGKQIVLLGYGKLWLFSDFNQDDFTEGKVREIDHGTRTQLESVCFVDNHTLLLSDEQVLNTGRNLYVYKLDKSP